MDEEIRIANEFAVVTVRKVETNAGERLELEAPKKDSKIRLDAVALESLTWQDSDLFSELLEDPHGPE